MEEKNELTQLVEQLILTKDDIYFEEMSDLIKDYSLKGKRMTTLINGKEDTLVTRVHDDDEYIPMFSEEKYIEAKGREVVKTSINDIIKPLIEDPSLGGLEINPFGHDFLIPTYSLLQMIIGKRDKFGNDSYFWKHEMPDFRKIEFMTKTLLLEYGQTVLKKECAKEGIKVLFDSNDPYACPNTIIKVNGEIAFAYVEMITKSTIPMLSEKNMELLLKRSKQFGMNAYYAPIVLSSTELEELNEAINSGTEGKYFDYRGLEKIEYKIN